MDRGAWWAMVRKVTVRHDWSDLAHTCGLSHSAACGIFLYCWSHVFWETNSLRRTMQIVECSLLRRRAQGRVSSWPRTLTSVCENLLYPMCMCPNPPPQIPWDLHKLRKGKYNPNNPITHVPCAQTVKQLASKHEVTLRQVQKNLWSVWRKGWLVYVFS